MESSDNKQIVFRSVLISTIITVVIVTYGLSVVEDRIVERLSGSEDGSAVENGDVQLPMQTDAEPIADVVERTIPAVVSVVITADVPVIERYYEEFSPFGGFFGDDFGFRSSGGSARRNARSAAVPASSSQRTATSSRTGMSSTSRALTSRYSRTTANPMTLTWSRRIRHLISRS